MSGFPECKCFWNILDRLKFREHLSSVWKDVAKFRVWD